MVRFLTITVCFLLFVASCKQQRTLQNFLLFAIFGDGLDVGHKPCTFNPSANLEPVCRVIGGARAHIFTPHFYHGTSAYYPNINPRSFFALDKGYAAIGIIPASGANSQMSEQLKANANIRVHSTPGAASTFLLVMDRVAFGNDIAAADTAPKVYTDDDNVKSNVNLARRFCAWMAANNTKYPNRNEVLFAGQINAVDRVAQTLAAFSLEGATLKLGRTPTWTEFGTWWSTWIRTHFERGGGWFSSPHSIPSRFEAATIQKAHNKQPVFVNATGQPDSYTLPNMAVAMQQFYVDLYEVTSCAAPPLVSVENITRSRNNWDDLVDRSLFQIFDRIPDYPKFVVEYLTWEPTAYACLTSPANTSIQANTLIIRNGLTALTANGARLVPDTEIQRFLTLLAYNPLGDHAAQKSRQTEVKTLASKYLGFMGVGVKKKKRKYRKRNHKYY